MFSVTSEAHGIPKEEVMEDVLPKRTPPFPGREHMSCYVSLNKLQYMSCYVSLNKLQHMSCYVSLNKLQYMSCYVSLNKLQYMSCSVSLAICELIRIVPCESAKGVYKSNLCTLAFLSIRLELN